MSSFVREPPDPEGHDPIWVWLRLFKKWLKGKMILSVTGGKMIPDPKGGYHLVIPQAKITPAGGVASAPAGNWNYRGGYNPANTYNTFDVTLLGAGTAAGMYLSTIDGNNNSPDSGIGWVQVMTGTGVWL